MARPPLTLLGCGSLLAAMALSGHITTAAPGPTHDPIADIISAQPQTLHSVITAAAHRHNIPPRFALAIATHESSLNPAATGRVGEIGLFQIRCGYTSDGRPWTAQVLGFQGDCHTLYDPATNAEYGARHLAQALTRTGGNLCHAATLHNRGLAARPTTSQYCERVMAHMRALP